MDKIFFYTLKINEVLLIQLFMHFTNVSTAFRITVNTIGVVKSLGKALTYQILAYLGAPGKVILSVGTCSWQVGVPRKFIYAPPSSTEVKSIQQLIMILVVSGVGNGFKPF